jgi:hypothetical protein
MFTKTMCMRLCVCVCVEGGGGRVPAKAADAMSRQKSDRAVIDSFSTGLPLSSHEGACCIIEPDFRLQSVTVTLQTNLMHNHLGHSVY